MKRRHKILLIVLVVIGLLAWLSMPGRGPRREVEAYKAKLRARGEKLTMTELAPRTTPEGIAAGKAFTNLMVGYVPPANYPSAMKFLSPGVALIGHTNIEPAEMVGYASNVARLTALCEIVKAPAFDFELDYSKESGMWLVLHITAFKSSATMLSITALQALHEKDYSTARSSLIAGADLVRLYNNEPLMISQLVRAAAGRIAISAAWEALQEDSWTEAQLGEFQAKWEAVDLLGILPDTFIMERAFGIDYLAKERDESYSQVIPRSLILSTSDETLPTGLLLQMKKLRAAIIFWRWKGSDSYGEELGYMQIADAAADVSRPIMAGQPAESILVKFQQEEERISKKYGSEDAIMSMFISGTGGGFSRLFQKILEAETARRLLVTAIALKRHHLQHGAYPTALAELTPTILKQVPADPWDGKPLRYQLKPDRSFLLYSIGADGKDDGGDPTYGGNGSRMDWVDGNDIVWPRAATTAEVGGTTANLINRMRDADK